MEGQKTVSEYYGPALVILINFFASALSGSPLTRCLITKTHNINIISRMHWTLAASKSVIERHQIFNHKKRTQIRELPLPVIYDALPSTFFSTRERWLRILFENLGM
jgi:hypothetical protein